MGTLIAILGVAGAVITAGTNIALTVTGRKHEIKTMEMAEKAAERKVTMILFICGLIAVLGFVGWSFYFVITQFFVATKYDADTTVHYSAGAESDWAYAQQRKEYSLDEECYLRVMTDVSASNLKGNNKDIEVVLTFSGTDICDINLFDGVAMNIQTDASNNRVSYSYVVKAHKEASEEHSAVSIFRYRPKQEGEVILKIEYGDQLGTEFDIINTVSFIE